MSENVEKVMNADPGMENDPRDTKEIEPAEIEEVVNFDLVSGVSMSTPYDATDWNGIYDQIPDMEATVLSLKRTFYELVTTPVENRDPVVQNTLKNLNNLHDNVGLAETRYDLRPDITDYEKTLVMIVNLIIILEGMTKTAQIANLRNMVSSFAAGGLTEDMINEFISNLNEIENEVSEEETTNAND